jgi:uncharacterized membrane protein YedE/YeeE
MVALSAGWAGLIGLGAGACVGFAVSRAQLCSLGAIESALVGGDWRRMKVFGLALAVALLGTQALILTGLLDEATTTYLPPRIAWLSTIIGSLAFGLGMALVGTCAFGCLVRMGGGDLRSLITMVVFSAVALMTLRGALSDVRLSWLESITWDMPGPEPGSLVRLASRWFGGDVRAPLVLTLAAGLILAVVFDKRLRRAPRLLTAGLVLGVAIVAGWVTTGVLVDEFSQPRPQSLTFVAPVARGLSSTLLGNGEWLDFGVLMVPGVVLGAFLSARVGRNFRWEAFDDHHEMRRHLLGAALMGFGGVLAGGCTVGQGLTAGSLLSVAWPIAVLGMIVGARLGLLILVEGSFSDIVGTRLQRWCGFKQGSAAE